jgi:Uma2 family endonuclease
MTMLAPKTMSVAEYLEFERTAEVRHEYVDGFLLEMPGETYQHNDIAGDIYIALKPHAKACGCRIAFESIKTRTRGSRYRYPDITVSCAEQADDRWLEQPCFIAEVTSDSTSDTDHGAKLEEYTKLPSVQCYAIVSQTTRQVIVYKRDADRWSFEVLLERGEFEIGCLNTKLSLDQIYSRLELA